MNPIYYENIVKKFDRDEIERDKNFSYIGEGSFGGKANGLIFIRDRLEENFSPTEFPDIRLNIPRMIVLRTDVFDAFMQRNNLFDIAFSEGEDGHIASEFMRADLPAEILGDLRFIIEKIHLPLAVRSSSMLEDAKYEPFAGIYATKMIANNQPEPDERFRKLIEAIKFVYASTYFKVSKDYFRASSHRIENEKMAVIIQEVVGESHVGRFYPNISGVARSYNFYPFGRAVPEDGVVNLALGLGKTIVDGGKVWWYSPEYPNSVPPYANPGDLLKNSQLKFWAVNMSPIVDYDPIEETEHLCHCELNDADYDGTLNFLASTYDISSRRFVMGAGINGPRLINFSRLLTMNEFKFNDFIKKLMAVCSETYDGPVEIEFAATINGKDHKMRFAFLQVRPMTVSAEHVEVYRDEMKGNSILVASDRVLGNGLIDGVKDIVYVMPEKFDKHDTLKIVREIESINRKLVKNKLPYLLIGFGRWGSSDPWLGIPVEWSQISGAKAVVESTLFDINVEPSQGSHFFHNLTSFNVSYFSITFDGEFKIDWDWLEQHSPVEQMEFIRHIKLEQPLIIKIDGKKGRGVIKKW